MKKWIVAVLVVVVAGAVGVTYYLRSTPAEASSTLITAPVLRGSVVEAVQATGTLEAVTTVQVGSQVSGTIKALHADFNSQVRQGQVVAELEESLFQAQVEQASASMTRLQADRDRSKVLVEDAQIKLKRARELSARQLLPASELDTAESTARQSEASLKSAEAQITQARASLHQNQVNLGHTIIKAPIDGIVVSRNVDVGQTVAASMQAPVLFVIAKDLAQMQVSAAIDESDIGRIHTGQSVTFKVDAYPDDTFNGTVRQVRLQPVVTQNVVSYTTIISVPNPTLKLRPGMTATVTVEIARADDVLRLPSAALRFRPTPELFASLGQEPPAGGFGPGGPGAGARTAGPDASRAGNGGAPSASPATAGAPAAGAGRQAASGPTGGEGTAARTLGANMSPEAREAFRQRMQNATPEERQRMREERRPERAAFRQRMQGSTPAASQGRGTSRPAARGTVATEIGGGPVEPPRITMRPVWLLRDGKLERVPLRVSISDGAAVAVVSGPIKEGDVVVTGVSQPAAARAQGTGNPLMPFGGRFPGPQGGGGGGGGNRTPGGGGGR
ncbi:MAG: efflux RND transporter periplasmic adaptor subunit [Vicinamibacterales bacterium]